MMCHLILLYVWSGFQFKYIYDLLLKTGNYFFNLFNNSHLTSSHGTQDDADQTIHSNLSNLEEYFDAIDPFQPINTPNNARNLQFTNETNVSMGAVEAIHLANIIIKPFNGKNSELRSFIHNIRLIETLIPTDHTSIILNFIIGRLNNSTAIFVPTEAKTFNDIIHALQQNIKNDSSNVLEARLSAILFNNQNLTSFSLEVETIANSLKQAYIQEGIPVAKSNSMTISRVVDLCRQSTNSFLIKSILASTSFDTTQSVLSKFLIESVNNNNFERISKTNTHLNKTAKAFKRFPALNSNVQATNVNQSRAYNKSSSTDQFSIHNPSLHNSIFKGHIFTSKGILPDSSKFNSISTYPIPNNSVSVKKFLQLCNYYRKFVPKLSIISSPLNTLTGKKAKFIWSNQCQNSFDNLKNSILNAKILNYPNNSKQFILTIDSTKLGIQATLSQATNLNDFPIAYASSSFSKCDRNKSSNFQELLSIHFSINYFKTYLTGKNFIVRLKHNPFPYLYLIENPTDKLKRIRNDLTQYDFIVQCTTKTAETISNVKIDDTSCIPYSMANRLKLTHAESTFDDRDFKIIPNSTVKTVNLSQDIPEVTFNTTFNDHPELSYSIRVRNLIHSHKLIYNPENVKLSLRYLFTELNHFCFNRGYKFVRIGHSDMIFKIISRTNFLKIAENALKGVSISIIEPTTAMDSVTRQLNLLRHFEQYKQCSKDTDSRIIEDDN